MIFINTTDMSVFESFDDVDRLLDTSENTFNMVYEMYISDSSNDKLAKLCEASFASVIDAIKKFFKILLGSLIDFFRQIRNIFIRTSSKIKKFKETYKTRLESLKGKTIKFNENISYIYDLTLCKRVSRTLFGEWWSGAQREHAVNIHRWSASSRAGETTEEEENKTREYIRRSFDFMGLDPLDPNANIKEHALKMMVKSSAEVKVDDLMLVINYVTDGGYDELLRTDGVIREYVAKNEKTVAMIEKELKDKPDVLNRSVSMLKQEAQAISRMHVKMVRTTLGIVNQYANSTMNILKREMDKGNGEEK